MRPRTTHLTAQEVDRQWQLVDAEGQILGRIARDIAVMLMGKHRPTWSPHLDCGDGVVVVNCEKVRVTGNKAEQKTYARYSGYPGGRIEEPYARIMEEHPERIIRKAVQRMLPKTILGRTMLKRLKIYTGTEHPHGAQQPANFEKLS